MYTTKYTNIHKYKFHHKCIYVCIFYNRHGEEEYLMTSLNKVERDTPLTHTRHKITGVKKPIFRLKFIANKFYKIILSQFTINKT